VHVPKKTKDWSSNLMKLLAIYWLFFMKTIDFEIFENTQVEDSLIPRIWKELKPEAIFKFIQSPKF